jgi:23S rRNA (guanosine2251-2'-O)-methyltransferase
LTAETLYGRQAVRESLRAGRRTAQRLLLAEGSEEKGALADILTLCHKRKIPIEKTNRTALDKLGVNHQGVALQTSSYPYVPLSDILERCEKEAATPLILLLDLIQDPQNLGSLLRTAESAGADGVVLPVHHAAGVTASVVNASAGACEHLRIAQANLAQAIEALKERNVWVAGLDMDAGAQSAFDAKLSGPLALVVGSEGEGIRPLIRRSCDFLLRLPILGKVESLNAAAAGSIALYLALRSRTVPQTSP